MATPPILDFDTLTKPISDDAPAGPELKEESALSPLYYKVKDAREAARTAERNYQMASGDPAQVASLESPDWRKVVELAQSILADKSKDLWVSAWLIEGLAREAGFAGLRDGFDLVRELAERFWEGIHPRPDEDGYSTTVAQLTGLNGQDAEGALIAAIDGIPLAEHPDKGSLSGSDFKQASNLQQVQDNEVRQQRIDGGAKTMAMFESTLRTSPAASFLNREEDILGARAAFEKMIAALDEKCGTDEYGQSACPPSSNILNALDEARHRLQAFARPALDAATAAAKATTAEATNAAEDGGASATGEAAHEGPMTSAGRLQTREDAFRVLNQLVEFFRAHEPHSPISYSLEQAVRWGHMSLPELMRELIADSNVRTELFRRTGLSEPESGER